MSHYKCLWTSPSHCLIIFKCIRRAMQQDLHSEKSFYLPYTLRLPSPLFTVDLIQYQICFSHQNIGVSGHFNLNRIQYTVFLYVFLRVFLSIPRIASSSIPSESAPSISSPTAFISSTSAIRKNSAPAFSHIRTRIPQVQMCRRQSLHRIVF